MALEGFTIGGNTAAPAAPAAPSTSSGTALKGFSIGATAPKAAAATSTPAAAPAPALQPAQPADTSGIFSKFMGFIGSVAGKASNAIANSVAPPDQNKLSGQNKSVLGNTLAYLPSELARHIVPGLSDIQDSTDATAIPASGPALKPFIDKRGKDLQTEKTSLDAEATKLNTADPSAVADFNARVKKFNDGIGAYKKDIDAYNKVVETDSKQTLPDNVTNVSGADVRAAIPTAIGQTAQGFAKAPIKAVADVWDTGRVFLAKNPNASFNIPGLGKVTSDVFDTAQKIQDGQDPISAALDTGSSSIFNVLFFADIVNRAIAPRAVPVAKTKGDINSLPKPEGDTSFRPTVDVGPKSFRLYEQPTAYNRAGPQVIPPEVLDTMKAQGIKLGSRFDPSQPVFFKVTLKGGEYTGTIMQVKPSYLQTALDALRGGKTTPGTETLPGLLGGGKTGVNTVDIASKAAPEDTVQLHTQTVDSKDIVSSVNSTIKNTPDVAQTHVIPPVFPPAESHVLAHNALRLLNGDTTKAKEGAQAILSDLKEAIATHGEDVARQALIDQLGVGEQQADALIREAKTPTTAAEIKAAHDKVLQNVAPELVGKAGQPVTGVNPNQESRLTPEEAAPYSKIAATRYYNEVIKSDLKEGNPVVIGGDDLKDHFGNDYNDSNHPVYSQAANALYERMLKENNAPNVVFTGGGPGSGKSEILVNHMKNIGFTGIVYDSNFSNYEGAKKQIEAARAAGKGVDVYGVLPNLDKARGFTLARADETGRAISDSTFAHGHSQFPAIVKRLLEEGILKPEEVHLLDTRELEGLDNAKNHAAAGKFAENPLAILDNVRYNKDELKNTHGKENYEKQKDGTYSRRVSQEDAGTRARQEGGRTPEENRADEIKKIHDTYLSKPEAQQELDNMVAELLDLSVAGYRSINEETGEVFGVESTFPEWVPEELRSMDLFRAVFGGIEKVTDLQYPSNPRAFRQRALFDHILAALDYRLGVDTYVERSAILSTYGEESAGGKASSPIPSEVQEAGSTGLEGSEGAQAEEINKQFRQPGGFINVGQAAEDVTKAVKQVQDTLQAIERARALTGTVRESIYQHENKRTATRQRLIQLAQQVGDMLDANGWNHLYHFDENKNEGLTPQEKEVYDSVILPLKQALSDTIKEYKSLGGIITPELFFAEDSEYTPRFAKEKGNAIDKIIDSSKKKVKSIANGGLFSKSLGTVDKSRRFHIATDNVTGQRHVIFIPSDKDAKILKFDRGQITELGNVKGTRTPKVKEFYDPAVREKLEQLARDLGITHKRVATGKSEGLGTTTAGVSMSGRDLIKTRLSPDQVLAHELGHQIDDKYGMQAFMSDDKYGSGHKTEILAEMRALADKRFEGREVTDSFKKYVRKGSEKMAVMFEAYISNRRMFQEVAPHLYDDFRDFLASHAELRPFLDIEGSVQLGSQTHGNVQTGKIGRSFVDDKGKRYVIGQATTKEIEANTKVRYHTNVLANYLVALDRSMNALSSMKLIERIKDENEFGEVIKKDSPDESAPDGWKSVGDVFPQLRGYHLEPRLAEAITDLAGRQTGQMHIPVVDELNNLLVSAIVLNPVMHVPNVLAGRGLAAAAEGIPKSSIKNLQRAINEVRNTGPLYLTYLEHGAPFMALKGTTKNFTDIILKQYTQEIENNPGQWEAIAQSLGHANPAEWVKGLNHLNESLTWGSNDIFFMHALLDYADTHGGTMEEAIREVSKRMADYRIPERVFFPGKLGRAASVALQSRAFMFARFHYSGVIKPWIEMAKESAGPNSTVEDRITGARSLAYLLLMGLLVYPLMDKMWKGITGSPTSYMSMAGPVKPVQVGEKLAQQGVAGIPAALQSVFSVTPALRAMTELYFNTDAFSRNPIYGNPPAEGFGAYGMSLLSPLASASRMTPGDFALSLFGVWTPKNVEAKTALNQMKYDELPALQVQVKKLIIEGNQDQADKLMAEFNTRAIATWNQYQLETGTTSQMITTDDQKQTFLKEWGIKEPGQKALDNAAVLYADGSLTSKSSLTDTVVTYAKAFGVSPMAAFERIFTGQRIVRVSHFGLFSNDSTIIVERMPVADSEKARTNLGATPGDSMQLDHVIPLEAGGTNDRSNLNLITQQQDGGEQQTFEDFLGSAVKQGLISQDKIREYSIRYKVSQGETLPDAYMQEFKDKYGSKPITLQEIEDAVNGGAAK